MLVWVLCTAVLLVQALGVVHRVSHGSVSHVQGIGLVVSGDANQDAGEDLLSALFSGHQDLSKCQSLDHLGSSAPASCAPALATFAPHAGTILALYLAAFSGYPAAHYRSRAPPYSV